ncbi:MAG: hypothetical protein R3F60_33700, partial [bacterium]
LVAPSQVVADAKAPGRVVALGAQRTDDLGPSEGGEIIRSTDDGATWSVLTPPVEGPCGALDVIGGDTDHLRVDCEGQRFETRDGGQGWQPFEGQVETRPQTTLVHGGLQYRATRDGLWRSTLGRRGAPVRVVPR